MQQSQIIVKTNNLLSKIILNALVPFQALLEVQLASLANNQTGGSTLSDANVLGLNDLSTQEASLLTTLIGTGSSNVGSIGTTYIVFNIYNEYICYDASLINLNLCDGVSSTNMMPGPNAIFYFGDFFTATPSTSLAGHAYTKADLTMNVYNNLSQVNISLKQVIATYQANLV